MKLAGQDIIGSDEKLSIKQSLFFGFQSVLACNLFLGPIVIIGIMQMNVSAAAALIASTFLACGIATIIQSGLFLRYQVIQGMSFAIFGAVISIAVKADFATVFGGIIAASVILMLLGLTKTFSIIVNKLIPGLVAGTVITIIGIALMPITWNSIIGLPGTPGINFLEAGVTFIAMIVFMRFGQIKNKIGRILSIGSVIYAIVLGTVVAAFFGHVDLSPVASAPWFAIPQFLPFGPPKFDISAMITMTFILLIVMVESVGTWFTISEMSGEKMDKKRLDRGVIGEGLGCLIGTFIGGLPTTSYASNSGVLIVTKVFSRYAAIGGGIIAIAMALCPKLMYLIAIVPSSVIWGVYGVICVMVVTSGLASIRSYPFTERNTLVIGTSILVTIGVSVLPPALVQSMPSLLSYLFGSAICIGALTAIIMNLILPEKASDKAIPSRSGEAAEMMAK
ncbi:purine/pyrimidine permease [Dehalobacter sp. DCM]|uniref:uracil-xanthine permease family protein n=1 Tax=Dehalobacter sp. DCM TaxID=2907827 RepID=UPI003081C5E8|nr:purine/pyrimidine permease [Dehalobacter sp. DCM]